MTRDFSWTLSVFLENARGVVNRYMKQRNVRSEQRISLDGVIVSKGGWRRVASCSRYWDVRFCFLVEEEDCKSSTGGFPLYCRSFINTLTLGSVSCMDRA